MVEYEYWHLITEISDEYKKLHPDIKVNYCINKSCINNGYIDSFNLKIGKEISNAYKVKYIGRLQKGLKNEIRTKYIKEFLDKYNKKVNKNVRR